MDYQFRHVPLDVERLRETGIFDRMAYTHATSHTSRRGIEKTKKLMSPRIALAHGIVPFSGEPLAYTYIFRAYYVSLSSYPVAIDGHNWRKYIIHGMLAWTVEESNSCIKYNIRQKFLI